MLHQSYLVGGGYLLVRHRHRLLELDPPAQLLLPGVGLGPLCLEELVAGVVDDGYEVVPGGQDGAFDLGVVGTEQDDGGPEPLITNHRAPGLHRNAAGFFQRKILQSPGEGFGLQGGAGQFGSTGFAFI